MRPGRRSPLTFDSTLKQIEAARCKLAGAVLSVARSHPIAVARIKHEALIVMFESPGGLGAGSKEGPAIALAGDYAG